MRRKDLHNIRINQPDTGSTNLHRGEHNNGEPGVRNPVQDQAAGGREPKESHQHVPLAQAGDGKGRDDCDEGDYGGENYGDREGAGVEGVAALCQCSGNNLEDKAFTTKTSVVLKRVKISKAIVIILIIILFFSNE